MKIGIIGGSGLYDLDGLENIHRQSVTTAFGEPSDEYVCGTLSGQEVFFLPRHGRGHSIMPSEINHRANILGFKMLGVERVISVSAVGSLRLELRPRDMVLPDQYFDRTKKSLEHTFFGGGVVAHVSFGQPTCESLRASISEAAARVIGAAGTDTRVQDRGTYVNMEGPAFSTKAESNVYRQWGFDVIGMTSLAEAKLCREAEMCYQSMAMVTDYDCWHEGEEDVSVERVIEHLVANTSLAKEILTDAFREMPAERECACGSALKNALITRPEAITGDARDRLELIVGKYL
ncbi:MAG: S-methyl-5'-thioadenosine phosphorylase [Lentisphaerae bacterium]|nr:S-methyl-5'-thioadenosine phosphorylase [Lentisphaerota bacterium]